MSAPDVRAAALEYARRGWPVLPVRLANKLPLTAHGVKDATTDPETIARWWDRWPRANLAVATGHPGPDVLDVDVKPSRSGLPMFERLRLAGCLAGAIAVVRTPSGGLHIYYPGTSQGGHAAEGRLVELKARGGYVLVPPSARDGRPYELVEERAVGRPLDWRQVAALLTAPKVPTVRHPAPGRGKRDIGKLVEWVAQQPEGNGNNGLYWAACRALETDPGADLDPLVAAAVRAGHPQPGARRTVASARRRILGAAE